MSTIRSHDAKKLWSVENTWLFPWYKLNLPPVERPVQCFLSPQGGTKAAYQVIDTTRHFEVMQMVCCFQTDIDQQLHSGCICSLCSKHLICPQRNWTECSLCCFYKSRWDPGKVDWACAILAQHFPDSLSHYQALLPECFLHNCNLIVISSTGGIRV